MHRMIAIGLLLAACGGGGGAPSDAEVDTAPAGPNQVTLSGQLPDTVFLAYRDGAGAWLPMERQPNGAWTMHVTDDYTFIVSCGTSTTFEAQMFARTWADGAGQEASCAIPSTVPPPTVTVTGQMVQPGTVWAGGSDSGTTSPWSFSIAVPTGVHDLFAVSADHVAARHGIDITADMTVPTFDVDVEGYPLEAVPLTLDGLAPADVATVDMEWVGTYDRGVIEGSTTQLLTPSQLALHSGDYELERIDARQPTSDRTIVFDYSGSLDPQTLTLMPSLSGVTFAGSVAELGALPTYDHVQLALFDATTGSQESFDASKTWIDTTAATSIGWSTPPTEYPTYWRIDPAAASRSVTARQGDALGWYTSSVIAPAG